MDISQVIYERLKVTYPKCYPLIAPQETKFPYVLYAIASIAPSDSKDRAEVDDYIYQVSVFSKTYAEMRTMAENVRQLLDRYHMTNTNDGEYQDVGIIFQSYDEDTDEFDGTGVIYYADQTFRVRVTPLQYDGQIVTVSVTNSGDEQLPVVNDQNVYFYVTDIAASWDLSFSDGGLTYQNVANGTGAGFSANRAIVVDGMPYMVSILASLSLTPGSLTIVIQFIDLGPLPTLNDSSVLKLYAYNNLTNDTSIITFDL